MIATAPSLHPYQDEGVSFLDRVERGLLGDEPGLGKSAQALRAAHGRTLVVAPTVAIEGGDWEYEWKLWRPDLDVTFAPYSRLCERIPSRSGRGQSIAPRLREEWRGQWDTIILDEVHRLKNRQAITTEAAWKLQSPRLYALTGTPIPNWAVEFFSILHLLYPGDRRFTSYWRWLELWFRTWKAPWGTQVLGLKPKLAGDHCECLFHKAKLTRICDACWATFYRENGLEERMLRRTWESVGLELPPLTEKTFELPMEPTQRRVYEDLKRDYRIWVEEAGRTVSAWSAGGLHTKLCKLQTGVGVEIPEIGSRQSNKLAAFRDLVEDYAGQSLVVFTLFRPTALLAAEIARAAGHSVGLIMGKERGRGKAKRDFQEGKISCLIGTLDSISESLQLTRGHIAIFIERSWRPTTNTQALRRIWRMGQEHSCLVIYLISKRAIDTRMTRVLSSKTDEQVRALTAGDFLDLLEEAA